MDTRKAHTRMFEIIIIILLWEVNYEIDNQTECELWAYIAFTLVRQKSILAFRAVERTFKRIK